MLPRLQVEQKAADRDAKLASAEAALTALEDNRTKLGFAIDSAKIEDEGKARDARRCAAADLPQVP